MTSVPKPLKFLKPHYENIKQFYENTPEGDFKKDFADVLSVFSMTMSEPDSRDSLKYVLQGTHKDAVSWG